MGMWRQWIERFKYNFTSQFFPSTLLSRVGLCCILQNSGPWLAWEPPSGWFFPSLPPISPQKERDYGCVLCHLDFQKPYFNLFYVSIYVSMLGFVLVSANAGKGQKYHWVLGMNSQVVWALSCGFQKLVRAARALDHWPISPDPEPLILPEFRSPALYGTWLHAILPTAPSLPLVCFKTESHAAQLASDFRRVKDDLELLVLLPPLPKCWDDRPVSPLPVLFSKQGNILFVWCPLRASPAESL